MTFLTFALKTKAQACGLMLTLLILAPSVYAQNLLQNGGFELGLTSTGTWSSWLSAYGAWTVPPGSGAATLGMPYFSFPPYEGSEAMVLGYDGGSAPGSITQSFATTNGVDYRISLAVFGWDGTNGTVRVTVSSGSYTIHAGHFVSPGGNGWGTNRYTFTATGPLTTLLIQNVSGGSIIDDVRVTAMPPAEYAVFGTGERTQLTNSVTSALTKLQRRSQVRQIINGYDFNYQNPYPYSVSIISSGTMVIDSANDTNNLFAQYFSGRSDIKEMELMAETLVIRSPLILKGTKVSLYARNLRFEATGRIVTTPEQKLIAAAGPRGPGVAGDAGASGLPGGNMEVYAGTLADTSTVDFKFVLTGGKGQDVEKGRHGADGTSLTTYWGCSTTFSYDEARYTPPCGWYVTRQRFSNGSIGNGVEAWPGDGTDGWPAGTPGRGGSGGTLITSQSSVSGVYSGGVAGLPGTPVPIGSHQSPTVCTGGNLGQPEHSIHIYNWDSGIVDQNQHIDEDGRHTSVAGKSYPVPTAIAGAAGGRIAAGSSYSWLNPALLRKIINDAKDDYLQNRITATESRLKDYTQILDQYRTDITAWNAAPQMARFELSQMYDEMQILLQQIANGLDYFGNPSGWVPMLSFEVNLSLFDQEIGRSLDMVYLSQWIAAKQDNASATFNALGTARTKLADEINDAKIQYDTAAAALAGFEGEAQALNQRVKNQIIELEKRDNQLHQEAIKNTRPPEWETALRVGLKVAGTLCKMVPVYQPALGAAGDALNLGSDFDPDNPWETITSGLDLSTSYLDSGIKDATDQQQFQLQSANLNTAQLKEVNQGANRVAKLQSLSTASSALSGGIKNISAFLEKSKAPSAEMEAELDKLRSQDPQYGDLVKDIRKLMREKREFADKIMAGVQNVASLSDLITRDILALDSMSVEIGANANLIDARVNAYLKDMERRAFDRLLKYHYYMAKAYEYRVVKPYAEQLDLAPLYNEITAIANANTSTNPASSGALTDGQREVLKSVFRKVIADTTESIIDDYNSNSHTDPGTSFSYHFTAEEIASLNRGEALTLNLANRGFFLATEENVRISNLYLDVNVGMATTGNYSSPAYVELVMEHSGLSNVKLNGQVHQFRHYNQTTRDVITWRSRYDSGLGAVTSNKPPISQNDSLLRSLIRDTSTQNMLLYSMPSAWADMKIWREGNNGGITFGLGDSNAPIKIADATLQISYYRTLRSDNPSKRRDVEVKVALVDDVLGGTRADDALLPYFTVSNSDPNGRRDAAGRFLRIYNYSNPATIQVTAQDLYQSFGFYKWTDNGTEIGTNRTINISTTADHRIIAHYVTTLPIPLTFNRLPGQNSLSWQGGVGIQLQTKSCLVSCLWQEVPGTEGQSNYIVPPSGLPSFFRLMRVR